MIHSNVWAGEPHRSESEKRVIRTVDDIVTYGWDGTPNDSTSWRKRGVKIVSQNLVTNPKPTDTHGYRTPSQAQFSMREDGAHVYRDGESGSEYSTPYIDPNTNYTGEVGDLVRFRVDVKALHPEAASTMRLRVASYQGMELEGGTTYGHELEVGEWTTLETECVIINSEGYFRALIWPSASMHIYTPEYFMFRNYLVEVGGTEHWGFYDGDTRDEKGVLLYKNHVLNPNALGGTYGWSGDNLTTYSGFNTQMWGGYEGLCFYLRGDRNYPAMMEEEITPISEGEWLGVRALTATEHGRPIRIQIHWQKEGSTFAYSSKGFSADAAFYPGKQFIETYQAPSGAEGYRIQIQLNNTENSGNPRLWAKNIMSVTGGTEAEVSKAIEEYSDGDSRDLLVPNTKVYYDHKWVSLYDHHS